MFNKSRARGFSFIEIAVTLLIIGILSAFVLPRLVQTKRDDWHSFATQCNTLIQTGVLQAQGDTKLHRIFFDLTSDIKKISLQVAQKKDANATDVGDSFAPVQSDYGITSITIPDTIILQSLYIGKQNEMAGGVTKRIWFFIGPDGSLQDVTLIFLDTEFERSYTLVANPFTGQLTVYDGAQQPT